MFKVPEKYRLTDRLNKTLRLNQAMVSDSGYGNKESGKTLQHSQRKASTQEDSIYGYFQLNPGALITAEECLFVVSAGTPITSVRRAVTNLMKRGKIEKTDEMRRGKYGKMIHAYRLKRWEY